MLAGVPNRSECGHEPFCVGRRKVARAINAWLSKLREVTSRRTFGNCENAVTQTSNLVRPASESIYHDDNMIQCQIVATRSNATLL